MKNIYIDVCALCRPYDNQNDMRIRLETDAFFLILENVKNKKYGMIYSSVHHAEIRAISDDSEKMELEATLSMYGKKIHPDLQQIYRRAQELHKSRLGIGDAAHIAYAEVTAEAFITCDNRLLKRCQKLFLGIKMYNPIEFCIEENLS